MFRPVAFRVSRHVPRSLPFGCCRAVTGVNLLSRAVPDSTGGVRPWTLGAGRSLSSSSSASDPYRTLGLKREASDDEIKKAYRKEALKWHPDKNPDDKADEAQKRFSSAAEAYDILKDPEKKREFDTYGRVGGMQGGPGGPGGPGGFQGMQHADAERLFREAFGQGGLDHIMQQFMAGGARQGGRRGPPTLQVGMDVRITASVEDIHRASRACKIDEENDERRGRCAGKVGTITKADPSDQSIKIRVSVQPGKADEVWFGAGAVQLEGNDETDSPGGAHPFAGGMPPGGNPFGPGPGGPFGAHPQSAPGGCRGAQAQAPRGPPPPRGLHPGTEVLIHSDVDAIDKASRASDIGTDNDEMRARCAGKLGTVVDADPKDQSVKVRVMIMDGKAAELWFGATAMEPLRNQEPSSQTGAREHHF